MGKILIAEDNPAMLRSLTMALECGGHKVQAVSDGLEAMAALARQHFDLLLTDIVMPKLDGVELTDIVMPKLDGVEVARHARAKQPGLRVTFMTGFGEGALRARNIPIDVTFITGFGEKALRERNIAIHGMRVLSKPFKLRELIEHVDDILLH